MPRNGVPAEIELNAAEQIWQYLYARRVQCAAAMSGSLEQRIPNLGRLPSTPVVVPPRRCCMCYHLVQESPASPADVYQCP